MAGTSRPAISTGTSSGRNLRAELDRLEGIYRTNLARPGVEIFDLRATLDDAAYRAAGRRRGASPPSTSWSPPAASRSSRKPRRASNWPAPRTTCS